MWMYFLQIVIYLFIYLFIYVNEGIIYCSAPCVWEAMMFKIQ